MILTGETEELGEKPVLGPLCPPQIPHGLTRARTWSSAVREDMIIIICVRGTNSTRVFVELEIKNVFLSLLKRRRVCSSGLRRHAVLYITTFQTTARGSDPARRTLLSSPRTRY
jgi:hypothetical protein